MSLQKSGNLPDVSRQYSAVKNTRNIGKTDMVLDDAAPQIDGKPETYEVRVENGELVTCEPLGRGTAGTEVFSVLRWAECTKPPSPFAIGVATETLHEQAANGDRADRADRAVVGGGAGSAARRLSRRRTGYAASGRTPEHRARAGGRACPHWPRRLQLALGPALPVCDVPTPMLLQGDELELDELELE